MELLWRLAADAPAVVIEANLGPYREFERRVRATQANRPRRARRADRRGAFV